MNSPNRYVNTCKYVVRMRSDSYYWREKKCVCACFRFYVRCYRVFSFIFSLYVISVFVFRFSVPSNFYVVKFHPFFEMKAFTTHTMYYGNIMENSYYFQNAIQFVNRMKKIKRLLSFSME